MIPKSSKQFRQINQTNRLKIAENLQIMFESYVIKFIIFNDLYEIQ